MSFWSFLSRWGKKKLEYQLKFTPDAGSSYDSLKKNADPRFPRIKKTLTCLKNNKLGYPELRNRRWEKRIKPNILVTQSCITQSEPDFHILWHYSPQDKNVIVILLIDLID